MFPNSSHWCVLSPSVPLSTSCVLVNTASLQLPNEGTGVGLWDAEVIFCGFYVNSCMCAHLKEWKWCQVPSMETFLFFSPLKWESSNVPVNSQLSTPTSSYSLKSLGFCSLSGSLQQCGPGACRYECLLPPQSLF